MQGPINFFFICGGKYHDMDFIRLEMLKLFAEDQRYRVKMAENFDRIDEIVASDVIVIFTVDVVPNEEQTEKLTEWVAKGNRLLGLHGSNSILEFLEDGRVNCPRSAPKYMEMLGSQFIGHPPISPYEVVVTPGKEDHPLVKNVDPMIVEDELYVSEIYGDVEVLMHTTWGGTCDGFVEEDCPEQDHPILYLKKYGKGEVLYFTLGHARSKYDLREIGVDIYPKMERGAWIVPTYYEVMRRCIKWSIGELV